MNEHVAHTGHFAPGNVRMFLAKRCGYAFGGFAKDFEAPDHRIDSLLVLCKCLVMHTTGELQRSNLKLINTCDEQGAGFAADAYARVNGLGVVCVTYSVGGLKVVNTTAQAFAEKSPVVVISGAPGRNERIKTALIHHRVRDFDTQLKIFEQITVASTIINDHQTACREIDRVLNEALRYKRPVYIELPRDIISLPVTPYRQTIEETNRHIEEELEEAMNEATSVRIRWSKSS